MSDFKLQTWNKCGLMNFKAFGSNSQRYMQLTGSLKTESKVDMCEHSCISLYEYVCVCVCVCGYSLQTNMDRPSVKAVKVLDES